MNTVQLATIYMEGSKRNENFNQEFIDRFDMEPQYFSENRFEVAVLTKRPIPEDTGKIVAHQIIPCEKEGGNCSDEDRVGAAVPLSNCSSETQSIIDEQWTKRWGEEEGQLYARNAVCLNMADFYLTGDPETN